MTAQTNPRLARLRMIVEREGLASAARRFAKPDRQLNDMLAGRKSFGEKVARAMEKSYDPSRPPGWLDTPLEKSDGSEAAEPIAASAVIEPAISEGASLAERVNHASAAIVSVLKAAGLDALCFGDIHTIKAAMKTGPQESFTVEEILRAAARMFLDNQDKLQDMNEVEFCEAFMAYLRNERSVMQRTKKE